MKKSKVLGVVVVGLLVAQQAKPDIFGMDIGVLVAILGQVQQEVAEARQIYAGIQQTKSQIEQMGAFVKSPGAWRRALDGAQVALSQVSNGTDNETLKEINEAIRASQQVYKTISYEIPTTSNMVALSELSLQQAQLKREADQLNASLQSIGQYQDKVKQSGDWGCVSCSIGAHQQ
jgi:conjugal transfer/entry exclusion protein